MFSLKSAVLSESLHLCWPSFHEALTVQYTMEHEVIALLILVLWGMGMEWEVTVFEKFILKSVFSGACPPLAEPHRMHG